MDDAMKQHPAADVLVSFASLRSAYESTVEALSYPQVSFNKLADYLRDLVHFQTLVGKTFDSVLKSSIGF
jgi:hypothetical protein